MKSIWLCLIVSALALPAGAQIHKWVDANGVTHYGERPPAQGKSLAVQLPEASPRQPGAAAPAPGASDRKERELEFRKRQVTRAEEEARTAQTKARRDEACRRARINLTNLRETGVLYDRDDRGEKVFLTDAQRDALVARREAEYKTNCP